ncbi:hypothetical protein ACHAW5_005042 [Stephanodiscus triporus]|uniref:Uncharacterized protein n=1 Tax=Stephanodiscus triporus TaxID=2934178 RepID=A0ABD3QTL5_9STRA
MRDLCIPARNSTPDHDDGARVEEEHIGNVPCLVVRSDGCREQTCSSRRDARAKGTRIRPWNDHVDCDIRDLRQQVLDKAAMREGVERDRERLRSMKRSGGGLSQLRRRATMVGERCGPIWKKKGNVKKGEDEAAPTVGGANNDGGSRSTAAGCSDRVSHRHCGSGSKDPA